jgi:hypothetical protein
MKSIFGNKKLEKLSEEPVAPDKKDYLEEFMEKEVEESLQKISKKTAPKKEQKEKVIPIKLELESELDPEIKSYKSYYAKSSSHNDFRNLVHTLRHKEDPDINNGDVFDSMLQLYREHIEKKHGEILKAKPPKRGRK